MFFIIEPSAKFLPFIFTSRINQIAWLVPIAFVHNASRVFYQMLIGYLTDIRIYIPLSLQYNNIIVKMVVVVPLFMRICIANLEVKA